MQDDIKKNFLEKERIGTMEKDLQRLREKTAEKERLEMMERIEKEPEQEIPQRDNFATLNNRRTLNETPNNNQGFSTDIRKPAFNLNQQPPKKDLGGTLQKLSVRIIFAVLIIAILGIVGFLILNKKPSQVEQTPVIPEQQTQEPEISQKIAPVELFTVNYTQSIEKQNLQDIISDIDSYYSLLKDFGFYRVLFENEERYFSGEEIMNSLEIFPQEILSLYSNYDFGNFMFFVYNNSLNKKWGTIMRINEGDNGKALNEMKNWETNMLFL